MDGGRSSFLPRLIEGGVDALAPLDRIICQPTASIVNSLAVNDKLSFNELKRLLELSGGHLSVHVGKLGHVG